MNTVNSSNLAALARQMEDFLPLDSTDVSLHDIHKFKHQGQSSIIYSFVLTYLSEGLKQRKDFILRIFKDKLVDQGLKEYLVLKTLQEFNFPAPIAYFFKTKNDILGNPFIIMERIAGNNGSNYINNDVDSKNFVDKMAESLARLHRLDPNCFQNSKELQERYENIQRRLFAVRFFIKNRCKTFLGFLPSRQRRFINAVKRLKETKPKKFHPALLHMDYEPHHVLVSNKGLVLVDWGEASVGDPAFDVARAYHNLRLGRTMSKVDLGEHFVKRYEKYAGQTLFNLDIYRDIAAMEIALWSGLSPFNMNKFLNYGKLIELTFGDLFGRFLDARIVNGKRRSMATHHTKIWSNIDYLRSYAIQYLERTVSQNK